MTTIDRQLRHDVALANRIIERCGLATAFGHASARIPGTDTFYIPTRRSPGLADANDLLVIDIDGNVLPGNGTPNSEFWIHARIYAGQRPRRHDARSYGITTAFANLRAATVAACFLEESAALQLRMLAAGGGNAARIRTFTREEAELVRDQTGPGTASGRAWEYYAAVAAARSIGGA